MSSKRVDSFGGMTMRFWMLDGLRGIAALMVLAHHLELILLGQPLFFGHGYLAVDFFFLLSGFVVAHVFEPKLHDGMGISAFLQERAERLYPMMALGVIAGCGAAAIGALTVSQPAARLVLQLIGLPFPVAAGAAFAFNPVQWSLFVEFVVNIVHVTLLVRWRMRALAALVLLSAAALVANAWWFGSLGLGWTLPSLAGGLLRGVFGYSAGVLLYRLHLAGHLPAWRVSPIVLAVILPALLLLAGLPMLTWRWYVDPMIVLLAGPLLLVVSINSRMNSSSRQVSAWIGGLSYPLYAVQDPLLYSLRHAAGRALSGHVLVAIGAAGALVAALVAWRGVDQRIANWLKRRKTLFTTLDASPWMTDDTRRRKLAIDAG